MRFSFLALIIATISCAAAPTPDGSSNNTPTAQAATGEDPNEVVAEFEGGSLTRADLNDYLGVTLIRLEAEYQTQRFDAERNGLDEMLAEKLLEAEAIKTGAGTVEVLLEREVTSKIPAPTEEQVQQFYGMMKRRMGNTPLEAVRAQVEAEITNRAKAERFQAYLTQVRDQYKVNVTLPKPELPRIPVSADDDPFLGPEDAAVTIIQFAEFQCPYCGRAKEAIDQLMAKYPKDVRVVFRDFPLGFHDRAVPAAVAANCAGEQDNYWGMYNALMSNQRALAESDLREHAIALNLDLAAWTKCRADPAQEAEVMKDLEDGSKVGVTGTPAFFINGIMLSGAQPYSAFEEIVERELANRD